MSKRNYQDFLSSCPEGRRLGKDYLRLGSQGQGQPLGKLRAPPSDPRGCEANSSLGQTTWGTVLQRTYAWGLAPLLSLSLSPLESIQDPFQGLRGLTPFRPQALPLRSWPRSAFRHFLCLVGNPGLLLWPQVGVLSLGPLPQHLSQDSCNLLTVPSPPWM